MKNFPNQAANFGRIRSTLEAVGNMDALGINVLDDGDLGYGLARRNLYTFRGVDYATATTAVIEARIAAELTKSPGDQGARTNARELRRTLHAMGWLSGTGNITPAGTALLATTPTSQQERDLLADGLLEIALADDAGNVSHPVAIMLHLLRHSDSSHRAGLELALVAKNDSATDLASMIRIYDTIKDQTSAQRAFALGVSETVRANSVKVFPPLAKYAGLITEDSQGVLRLAPPGLARIMPSVAPAPATVPTTTAIPPSASVSSATEQPDDATPPTNPSAGRRNLTQGRKRLASETGQKRRRAVPTSLTPEQQVEAQNRLNERTDNHQDLVSYFSGVIGDSSGELFEDSLSFDLLWEREDKCHVFEMKTIDADADSQVIRAVGQLLYYKHFNVANQFPGKETTLSIVVDCRLPIDLCGYLEELGIGLILAIEGLGVEALNQTGDAVVALLPPSPDDA